jgi:hypothetical protein
MKPEAMKWRWQWESAIKRLQNVLLAPSWLGPDRVACIMRMRIFWP